MRLFLVGPVRGFLFEPGFEVFHKFVGGGPLFVVEKLPENKLPNPQQF
jgi:hypothetical protein